MKKCPYCAEEIQDDALKCRFCGEFIKKRKKWLNCFTGCLITFFITALLIILFIYFSFLLLKFMVYKAFFSGPNFPKDNPHFIGPGADGMMRDFADAFRHFWDKLKDFFQGAQDYNRVTF